MTNVRITKRGRRFTTADLEAVPLSLAIESWRHTRLAHGFAATTPRLMAAGSSNAKLNKNDVPTFGLSLAPHRTAGVGNLCHYSTHDCRMVCLFSAGRGRFAMVQRGRIVRTVFLAHEPLLFHAMLRAEILAALKSFGRRQVAFRLNVVSDIDWHSHPWLADLSPRARFYAYTKDPARLEAGTREDLTFSISERQTTPADVVAIANDGHRVAMVADWPRPLPTSWHGAQLIDGEKSDARFQDARGAVVILSPKGKAKNLTPRGDGFVKPAEWVNA